MIDGRINYLLTGFPNVVMYIGCNQTVDDQIYQSDQRVPPKAQQLPTTTSNDLAASARTTQKKLIHKVTKENTTIL